LNFAVLATYAAQSIRKKSDGQAHLVVE